MSVRRKGKEAAKLLYDTSESADMLYATGIKVPDPFLFIQHGAEELLVMSDLEYGRAKSQSRGKTVLRMAEYRDRLTKDGKRGSLENIIDLVLKDRKVKDLLVPRDFPTWLYQKLVGKQYRVKVADGLLFPERAVKSKKEIGFLEAAQRVNEGALERAISMITDAKVRKGVLYLDGKELTSERVKTELEHFYLDHGYECPDGMIVACGPDSALPHHRGEGPLYAEQSIILDLFPRSKDTGYWADMTRTVVKGKAPERLRKMYDAVLASQLRALDMVKEGVLPSTIHTEVVNLLADRGYPTKVVRGKPQGMIHGTGHGLGLDIHEYPSLGGAYKGEKPLEAGQVVTVEPGVYYPGFGGVRIEDFVLVQKKGNRNFTKAKKFLEID